MPVFEAQSSKGENFIYNEFITKNLVVIGDSKFSAKDFLSTLKQSEINKNVSLEKTDCRIHFYVK
jgi:hypothetical protein